MDKVKHIDSNVKSNKITKVSKTDKFNLSLNLSEVRKEHYNELINHMPFIDKVYWAKTRIKEFLNECIEYNKKNPQNSIKEITVSFSGGKDSTVLLDLVLKVHLEMKCKIPIIPLYALEITFPSTLKFINSTIERYQEKYNLLYGLDLARPKMPWNTILETKGYPIFSKQISVLINRVKNAYSKNSLTKWFFGIDKDKTNTLRYKLSKERLFLLDNRMYLSWSKLITTNEEKEYFSKYDQFYFISEKCCDFVKGNVKHDKRPSFIGVLAEESEMRKKSWINNGCNIFGSKSKKSRPLSIWKTSDIWKYIKENNLRVNDAYGYDASKDLEHQSLRFTRLGCTACPFGSHVEQKLINFHKSSGCTSKQKPQNRYEKLYDYNYVLYKSQVIQTGMYKILIDMGIRIENDEKYMRLFEKRREEIEEWKKDFRNNLLRIMAQIENPKNYKNKKSKGSKKPDWKYNMNEIRQALQYFGLDSNVKKEYFEKIRKKEQEFYLKYVSPYKNK